MKKIGIITFHAPYNYGSSLQNYALQQVLKSLGLLPETINLRTEKQKEQYDFFKPIAKLIDKKRILLKIAYSPFKADMKTKAALFEHFMAKELLLSKEVNSAEQVAMLERYDGYIVGSDQCWNLGAKDFDWSYFLEFVPAGIPKISYAISMGPDPCSLLNAPLNVRGRIANALDSFTALSTRDENTASVIRSFAPKCKDIKILPDPTLLLSPETWEKNISEQPLVEGDYIFVYNPYYIADVYDCAKLLSKKTGLKVVVSNINPKALLFSPFFERHLAAGPWEFLNMVKNAKYVVGRSFHLLVFSILLQKRFVAVEGMGDSRLANLLKLTGLESCATAGGNLDDVIMASGNVNFSDVFLRLEEQRNEAVDFLRNALCQ